MADLQTLEHEGTALKHDADADKSITVLQQKLDESLQGYLRTFCKRHPSFAKDAKINRDHVLLEVERFWPDKTPLAQKLWEQIRDIVHRIPPASTSSAVLLRVFVVSKQDARASLPQPKEAAVIAAFDSADGIVRSYVVPVYKELPTFDDMSIPAGLMVICQAVPPLFNQFQDNRAVGMGAGADIYGARSVDIQLGGDDGEDEKFTTPTLGMLYGLGGPPILGVPPMGQTIRYDTPPQAADNQQGQQAIVGGAAVAAAAAAATAAAEELRHIEQRHAHDRRLHEQKIIQERRIHAHEVREQEIINQELREQQIRLQEAKEQDIRNKEAKEQEIKNTEIQKRLLEQQRETEIILAESQAERRAETRAEASTSHIAHIAEGTEISELAKDSVIAEAEITSPKGFSEVVMPETPTRPEVASGAVEGGLIESTGVESRAQEVGSNTEGQATSELGSSSQAESEASAGAGETAEGKVDTITRGESGAESDPTFISGASGTLKTEAYIVAATQSSDESQEESNPVEEAKETADKLKEQMGDEDEMFTGGDKVEARSSSLEETEGLSASTEGQKSENATSLKESSDQTVGEAPERRTQSLNETGTALPARAAEGAALQSESGAKMDPTFISGASGSLEAETYVAARTEISNPSQDQSNPIEDAREMGDKLEQQMGNESKPLVGGEGMEEKSSSGETEKLAAYDEGRKGENVPTLKSGGKKNLVQTRERQSVNINEASGAVTAQSTEKEILEAEAHAKADPTFISGSSGSVETEDYLAAKAEISAQSQEQSNPAEDVKETADKLREQMGDEDKVLSSQDGLAQKSAGIEKTDKIMANETGPMETAPSEQLISSQELSSQSREHREKGPHGAGKGKKKIITREKALKSRVSESQEKSMSLRNTSEEKDEQQGMAEHLVHAHDLVQHLGHVPGQQWSAKNFLAAPTLTHTSTHALRTGHDLAALGTAAVVGRKRTAQRKTTAATTEARVRKNRAQEWRSARKKIKAATVKNDKKRAVAKTIRLNPDKLDKLTPDD